jgi:hypothetical protein
VVALGWVVAINCSKSKITVPGNHLNIEMIITDKKCCSLSSDFTDLYQFFSSLHKHTFLYTTLKVHTLCCSEGRQKISPAITMNITKTLELEKGVGEIPLVKIVHFIF